MSLVKLLFFLGILLGAQSLSAQTNFVRGYYLSSANDTIRGFIEYRSEGRNYRWCVFRKEKDAGEIRFSAAAINGYVVDETDYYEKHTFKDRKGKLLVGFFRVLVRGTLSLLRHQSRFFVKDAEGKLFEVTKDGAEVDGKVKDDTYGAGILKVLTKDCEEISESYLLREYRSARNLPGIIRKYNACVGSTSYEPSKIALPLHIGLGMQVSPVFTQLKFTGSLAEADLGTEASFGGGAYASLFVPRFNERFRLVVEANYARYNQYAYFSVASTNNDLFVEYSFLRVPLLIRYSTARFFIDVGMQNQYMLNQDLRWRVESVQQGVVSTTDEPIVPFQKSAIGYVAGVGVKFRLTNLPFRSSLRYSAVRMSDHPNEPSFQMLELNLSFDLIP